MRRNRGSTAPMFETKSDGGSSAAPYLKRKEMGAASAAPV